MNNEQIIHNLKIAVENEYQKVVTSAMQRRDNQLAKIDELMTILSNDGVQVTKGRIPRGVLHSTVKDIINSLKTKRFTSRDIAKVIAKQYPQLHFQLQLNGYRALSKRLIMLSRSRLIRVEKRGHGRTPTIYMKE